MMAFIKGARTAAPWVLENLLHRGPVPISSIDTPSARTTNRVNPYVYWHPPDSCPRRILCVLTATAMTKRGDAPSGTGVSPVRYSPNLNLPSFDVLSPYSLISLPLPTSSKST